MFDQQLYDDARLELSIGYENVKVPFEDWDTLRMIREWLTDNEMYFDIFPNQIEDCWVIVNENKDRVTKVSAKEIINHMRNQYNLFSNLTPEDLQQTVGEINGLDMDTYNKGYIDALKSVIGRFENRV